eukprot:COSAG06_NODE_725_length_12789_cov_11.738534_5_plen_85_part_00
MQTSLVRGAVRRFGVRCAVAVAREVRGWRRERILVAADAHIPALLTRQQLRLDQRAVRECRELLLVPEGTLQSQSYTTRTQTLT